MTHSSVLFVARANFDHVLPWKLIKAWKVLFLCLIMATNFLELATTLTNLGAKWLPEKKLILRPVHKQFVMSYNITSFMYNSKERII